MESHFQNIAVKTLTVTGLIVTCSLISVASWAAAERPNFTGTYLENRALQTGEMFEFTSEGEAAFERNKAGIAASDPEIDTALKCQPQGIPRMLHPGILPFTILQTPAMIGFISEAYMLPRIIYLADTHREGYWRTFMGDAIAHWEGDTLVVDTVNLATTTFLDMGGLPHSDALHVTERWSLGGGGKTMRNAVTIDDGKYFKKPWTTTYNFVRHDDVKIVETTCENTRVR